MKTSFSVTNSAHQAVELDTTDIEKLIENFKDANWLCIGEITWDDAVDDVINGKSTSQEIKGILRACSDNFRHNLYRVVNNGIEVHEYTHLKQGGMSKGAAIVRDPDAPFGWSRRDYVAGKAMDVATVIYNRRVENGWEKVTEAAVPEAQAKRHDLVSYWASPEFKGMRMRIPPFLKPYFATILSQWVEEDDVKAFEDRNDRIAAAIEWNGDVKPVMAANYKNPETKKLVEESGKKAIMLTTIHGTKVDVWSLPSGTYDLAFKGNLNGRGAKFLWDGSVGAVHQAEILEGGRFYLVTD